MAKLSVLVVATLLVSLARAEDYDIEILPESCDCRDWYGLCRTNGEKWVDDDVWKYSCEGKDRSPVIFSGCHGPGGDVPVGQNVTIDGLWNVCTQDDQKLYFEIEPYCDSANGTKIKAGEEYREDSFQWLCLPTGRWITGCYYFNETHTDLLLRVGEHAYNGLIEHVCAKRQEYPAIVQYYTQVRKDVDVKHPTNKGVNRNFPPPLQKLIDEDQNIRWLHNSAVHFVKNDVAPRSFTRFLPSSRKPLG
uniref:Abnormal cell migration protein 18-like fibronectin type I domain-containing protein n=1 Tax=Caenorhabditis japonica TaxID=281687 RepID=A0A8R1DES4_CAEJA